MKRRRRPVNLRSDTLLSRSYSGGGDGGGGEIEGGGGSNGRLITRGGMMMKKKEKRNWMVKLIWKKNAADVVAKKKSFLPLSPLKNCILFHGKKIL